MHPTRLNEALSVAESLLLLHAKYSARQMISARPTDAEDERKQKKLRQHVSWGERGGRMSCGM